MQPRHHRPSVRLLDTDPNRVHPDIGGGIEQAHHRQYSCQEQRCWHDGYQWQEQIDRKTGANRGLPGPESTDHHAAHGGSDEGSHPAESEGQAENIEVEPKTIANLR
jgi:hypothetical protein